MNVKTTLALATVIATVATTAFAATAIKSGSSDAGTILTDGDGMSLYTFDKDTSGVSNCYDNCAALWPPLTASKSAKPQGDFGIVERKDGDLQWTHKGMPLYTWINDEAAGDITGDGVKGVWHLARP